MTSISSVGAYAPAQATHAVAPSDPDHDGDNDAGKNATAEASERGPATQVTLSPQAQALLNAQKGKDRQGTGAVSGLYDTSG